MTGNFQRILPAIIWIALFTPLLAVAETQVNPGSTADQDDWEVDIGVFWAGVDTKVRADGKLGGRSKEVDLEDDLGLSDREALVNLSAYYRGWDKWVLGLEWFELKRDTSHILEREIDWNNNVYPIGVQTNSYFDLNVLRLSLGYILLDTPRSRIGVSLGVHGMGAQAGIKVIGSVGSEVNFGYETESEVDTGAILPLPNLGIWGNYVFSDKLTGKAGLDGFALEFDEYSGSLWRLEAELRYKASNLLSLGIGFTYFHMEVDMNRTLWKGRVEFSYYGPKAFASFAF